jgi:hypothetical protein
VRVHERVSRTIVESRLTALTMTLTRHDVHGAVRQPTAVLIRPDGYVAWVGEGNDTGVTDALRRWLGAPS